MTASPFVGTWRLVSMEGRTEEGEVTYLFGRDALGQIVYTDDGHMSVHLMAANRPNFASGDLLRGTTAEKVTANDTYLGYCGKYEVREGMVIHQVENSSYPNYVGTTQERYYEFDGDRLVLWAAATQWGSTRITPRLIWERTRN